MPYRSTNGTSRLPTYGPRSVQSWSAVACHRFRRAEQAGHHSHPFSQATILGASKAVASHRTPKSLFGMTGSLIESLREWATKCGNQEVRRSNGSACSFHGKTLSSDAVSLDQRDVAAADVRAALCAVLECGGLPPLSPRRTGRTSQLPVLGGYGSWRS
jgi:hypothetical protein